MGASILGSWSAEALYPEGPMSDYILTFLPDQTGCYEEINVCLNAYEIITWELNDYGAISILAVDRRFKDGGIERSEAGTITMRNVPYSINHRLAPNKQLMDILTLDLPFGQPCLGFPREFGGIYTIEELRDCQRDLILY